MSFGLSVDVIDPCNRTGKITIPLQHIAETKGLAEFQKCLREGKELSLCLLFQKGRCNAGSRCHQIHASPEFVASLRQQAASTRHCCAAHGDVHSAGFLGMNSRIVTIVDENEEEYAFTSFARTSFLDAVLRSCKDGSAIRIPRTRICRLHSQNRCKFGKDCKHAHLCGDAKKLMASPLTSPVLETLSPIPAPKVSAPLPIELGMDMSCGMSSVTSKPTSTPSSIMTTPRGALMSVSKNQSFASESSAVRDEDFPAPLGLFSYPSEPAALDMSAFESTIRSLCEDLERAEFSPGSALRVNASNHLFE